MNRIYNTKKKPSIYTKNSEKNDLGKKKKIINT